MPKTPKLPFDVPKWLSASWDKVAMLTALLVVVLLYPGQNIYVLERLPIIRPFTPRVPVPIPTPKPYPRNTTGVYPGDEVSAAAVVVTDADSGVNLFRRNAAMSLAPASTTKILTALVALEHYGLDDVVTVKQVMTEGQVMGLVPGERITVENLLYGALIHSGNDAAYALAEHYPGGAGAFVAEMNRKAASLHLTASTFTNPMGYDDPAHKMSATDLSRLAIVALTDRTIAKMVAIPQITISDITHTHFHRLANVNQLLGKIPGVGGIKTGWTEDAGENLVTLVERGGHRVVIVVLRSRDRFGDTTKLIEWIFGNFDWETIGR